MDHKIDKPMLNAVSFVLKEMREEIDQRIDEIENDGVVVPRAMSARIKDQKATIKGYLDELNHKRCTQARPDSYYGQKSLAHLEVLK